MRRLTVSGGQAVVPDVKVLVGLRLLRLRGAVGADSRVHRAGDGVQDGGQDGGRRRQGDDVTDFSDRTGSLCFLLRGFSLLLLLPLLRPPPQLLPLPLDDRHPVPYGPGHELEVCLAHKAEHNLRKRNTEKWSGHNMNTHTQTYI